MAMLCSFLKPQRALLAPAALVLGALAGLCGSPALLAADSKKAAAPKLSAVQIVEKHVAARGGLQAWKTLQTLSVSGKMDAGAGDSALRSDRIARLGVGATAKHVPAGAAAAANKAGPQQVQLPFTLEMKRPRKSRLEIQFAGKTAVQVFDGTNGWKVRPFLNRNDVDSFTAEELKSEADQPELEGPL